MKNFNQEAKLLRMRLYHRNKRWRLSAGGLMIPHVYPKPRKLSWWDDVGFILNGRRVMVWWVHPRMKYADAIEDAAYAEAGDWPQSSDDMFSESKKTRNYKRLGQSRKKIVSYTLPPMADDTLAYYKRVNEITDRMYAQGIDLVIRPSVSIVRLDWCIGVDLCIPIEVLTEDDVIALAATARRMLTNGRTLAALASSWPDGFQYGREEWLAEAEIRQQDRENRSKQMQEAQETALDDLSQITSELGGYWSQQLSSITNLLSVTN